MKKLAIVFVAILLSILSLPVMAISESREKSIVTHCDSIKENLKAVQKADSKARVYLGGYYETIFSKFITPLNVSLVENNLSNAKLIENQNEFSKSQDIFAKDFISYQQNLEELISMDCKNQPAEFYEKLVKVREKRKTMEQDTLKIRSLISEHAKLVDGIKGKVQ